MQLLSRRGIALALSFVLLSPAVAAQIGGNGSDGPFLPDKDAVLDTRWKGGMFNFTKIVIPKTVTVIGPNPALLYCTGIVQIDRVLDAVGNGAVSRSNILPR